MSGVHEKARNCCHKVPEKLALCDGSCDRQNSVTNGCDGLVTVAGEWTGIPCKYWHVAVTEACDGPVTHGIRRTACHAVTNPLGVVTCDSVTCPAPKSCDGGENRDHRSVGLATPERLPTAPVPLYPSISSVRRARDEQTSAEATVWTVGREQYPHGLLRASEGRGLVPVASASAAFALVSGLQAGVVHKNVHKAVEIGPKSALSAVTSTTDAAAEEVAR